MSNELTDREREVKELSAAGQTFKQIADQLGITARTVEFHLETIEQSIEEAVDALDEAITGRINTGEPIPAASPSKDGQYLIPVPSQTAFKAALYEEITNQGLSKVELAAKLGIDEREVRRLLDPHHPTKLPRIAEILERVGKRVVVSIEEPEELLVHA